jgi:hypothetical protein
MSTEPSVAAQDSNRWVVHAVYLGVICGAVLLTWLLTNVLASLSQLDLKDQVRDISFLMDQYFRHRDETGEWPEAKNLYGNRFRLKNSVESDDTRIDTFFSPPEMWLQFQLKDEGEIAFDVSWGASPPATQ